MAFDVVTDIYRWAENGTPVDTMDGGWLVLGLIILPAVLSLLCMTFHSGRSPRWVVIIAVAAIWAMVAAVAYLMLQPGYVQYPIPGTLADYDLAIFVLDLALAVFFAYVGWTRRNWPIVAMAVTIFIMTVYLDVAFQADQVDRLLLDRFGLLMLIITNVVGGTICLFALKYMEHDKAKGRFFALMLLFLAVMNGAVLSMELTWLFFFWEGTTFCSYALIAHERTKEAYKAADRALLMTLFGALCFSVAMVLLASAKIPFHNLMALQGSSQYLPFLAIPLLMVAAFTKSAQLPFQSWLVGAMVAPTPVSALLHSATMVNLGVYLAYRLWPLISEFSSLQTLLLLVGGTTFLASTVLALRQSDAKRVLAYSTIGTLALIFMSLGVSSDYGPAAAVLLLTSHAVAKAILFMTVGAIKHETGSQDVEDMEGLLRERPFLAYSLYLGVFLMLLPPFGVFAGKLILVEALAEQPWAAFIVAIGFAGMIVYYGKWLGRTLVDKGSPSPMQRTSNGITLPLGFLIVLGISLVLLTVPFLQQMLQVEYMVLLGNLLWPPGTGWWELPLDGGLLPLYALLALMALAFVLMTRWVRRPEQATTAYACGEKMDITITGQYLYSEANETKFRRAFEIIGVLLVAALLLVPYIIEEVLA